MIWIVMTEEVGRRPMDLPERKGTMAGRSRWRMKLDALTRVAFWQMAAFVMMILYFWVDEMLDLSTLWFGGEPRPFNIYRACIATVGIILVAIVAIGNTYVQEKRIISGFLTVCADCRKVRVAGDVWENLDEFISEHSVALISHGLCPECYGRMEKELSEVDRLAKSGTTGPSSKGAPGRSAPS